MKKTIIRIVAVAMLALMVLTALPAFAYNIVGTAAAQTPVYKDTKGRKVELYVSGPVTINRQDNKSGMYNVTVSYDGSCARNETYIPALLSYAEEHGLTPAGPILELLLADIHQTDDVQECRTELQILCETC